MQTHTCICTVYMYTHVHVYNVHVYMYMYMQVITKDSNVMVVAVAGNIVAGLATGLRRSFQSYAPSVSHCM